MRYSYDGSFEGFLCALAVCLESGQRDGEFLRPGADGQGGLFAGAALDVVTERETALRFRERFVSEVSREAFATLRYAFHSEVAGVEELLWRYVVVGLEQGRRMRYMLARDPVSSVCRLSRKVVHEAHRFTGFVRFREVSWPAGEELDGEQGQATDRPAVSLLYARIEPDADILTFIAPHFRERLNDRPWMIHDLRRSSLVLCDQGSWRLVRGVALACPPGLTADEELCSRLWRSYFQRMAIPERHNPRLQQNLVPLRFRAHLVEFDGSV
ncbi:MAG: TIGR03915 family putative DNA repair protein [Oryzomonas sp.]|uniref:TIGR03915 family putative DNA repair protein n=1 Tax=Oryzomonas sp. TaxID=2855186 RepID=UPI0028437303|nr:TIGR03915 family putative DNA repair protein [Oryzomonas sp.]MDR3581550.1 TIGR03915 family putative DNA repair protein [Oryzomonas sp.]